MAQSFVNDVVANPNWTTGSVDNGIQNIPSYMTSDKITNRVKNKVSLRKDDLKNVAIAKLKVTAKNQAKGLVKAGAMKVARSLREKVTKNIDNDIDNSSLSGMSTLSDYANLGKGGGMRFVKPSDRDAQQESDKKVAAEMMSGLGEGVGEAMKPTDTSISGAKLESGTFMPSTYDKEKEKISQAIEPGMEQAAPFDLTQKMKAALAQRELEKQLQQEGISKGIGPGPEPETVTPQQQRSAGNRMKQQKRGAPHTDGSKISAGAKEIGDMDLSEIDDDETRKGQSAIKKLARPQKTSGSQEEQAREGQNRQRQMAAAKAAIAKADKKLAKAINEAKFVTFLPCLIIAIIKDITDVIELAGDTTIVVGIIVWLIGVVLTIIFYVLMWLGQKGSIYKWIRKKIIWMIVVAIIDNIPLLDVIPTLTLYTIVILLMCEYDVYKLQKQRKKLQKSSKKLGMKVKDGAIAGGVSQKLTAGAQGRSRGRQSPGMGSGNAISPISMANSKVPSIGGKKEPETSTLVDPTAQKGSDSSAGSSESNVESGLGGVGKGAGAAGAVASVGGKAIGGASGSKLGAVGGKLGNIGLAADMGKQLFSEEGPSTDPNRKPAEPKEKGKKK
ncbi:MAG: hypothetical protein Q8P90_00905 [bacterium]|nr:hypothetical protein [bacterium]